MFGKKRWLAVTAVGALSAMALGGIAAASSECKPLDGSMQWSLSENTGTIKGGIKGDATFTPGVGVNPATTGIQATDKDGVERTFYMEWVHTNIMTDVAMGGGWMTDVDDDAHDYYLSVSLVVGPAYAESTIEITYGGVVCPQGWGS